MPDIVITDGMATLNITWAGQNGNLVDLVAIDASEQQIKTWAAEAIRSGSVPGISSTEAVDFSNFVVERVASANGPTILLRPKTPFGMIGDCSRSYCKHSIVYHAPVVGCLKCDCEEYQ